MMKHLVVVAGGGVKPARRRFEVVIGVISQQQTLDFGNELAVVLLGERDLRQDRGLGGEARSEKQIQVAYTDAEAARGTQAEPLGCPNLRWICVAGLVSD